MLALILILGSIYIAAYLRAIYIKLEKIADALDRKNGSGD